MRLTELFTGKRLLIIASVLTFLLPSFSYAQTGGPYPHIKPQKPKPLVSAPAITVKPRKKNVSGIIVIPSLKGVVFVSSVKSFNKNGVSPSVLVNGLYIKSLPLLNNAAFIKNISLRLDKPLTFKDIDEILSLVRSLYKSHNMPFMDVIAPPQNVSNGILQIVVIQYRVGMVKVSGNRYFSKNFILAQSGIYQGQVLSKSALVSDMNWLNKNPFLHTEALLSPGSTAGSMDINLLAKDVVPFRVYAGYDNQGIPSLGMNEWNAGFNYGNAFGLGQMLSYQLAQSFNARYRSDSLSYEIPFPWKGRLELLGSYSTASPYINRYFSELGRNAQASVYYKQELPSFYIGKASFNQTAGAGYDFKTTNNNLAFGGLQVFQGTAQIDQFPLFYKLSEADSLGITSLSNRFVISPGDMNADNSTASFNTIYAGTRSNYIYDNIYISRQEYLPLGTRIISGINFQDANHNLLYSEQLAAGGIYSAPGYSPDAATGSKGVMLNEELKLPAVNIAPVFQGTVPAYKNAPLLVGLGLFWDYADLSAVDNVTDITGLPNTAVLESAGVSLHTVIGGHFDLRFALGWKLRHAPYGTYGKGLFEDIAVTGGL
jgi:hemolysin activation/secretion protein